MRAHLPAVLEIGAQLVTVQIEDLGGLDGPLWYHGSRRQILFQLDSASHRLLIPQNLSNFNAVQTSQNLVLAFPKYTRESVAILDGNTSYDARQYEDVLREVFPGRRSS